MKTLFDHLEHIKGKPHGVRKQVAFGLAGLGTALVAFVWLATSLSSGSFAITGSSFAQSTGQGSVIAVDSSHEDKNQNLAGAVAALPRDTSVPAHIEIVNATSSSMTKKQSEQTTIPF